MRVRASQNPSYEEPIAEAPRKSTEKNRKNWLQFAESSPKAPNCREIVAEGDHIKVKRKGCLVGDRDTSEKDDSREAGGDLNNDVSERLRGINPGGVLVSAHGLHARVPRSSYPSSRDPRNAIINAYHSHSVLSARSQSGQTNRIRPSG